MSSIIQSSLKLNIFKISHQVSSSLAQSQIHFLNFNLKISTGGSELQKVFVDYTLKANQEQCINDIVVSGNIYLFML